ncbi:MAG TPA: ABC transporter ATP-binding protein [Spirochaetia bacterium]|nr:ABC transporter ATP-binding protein [Spirochaetia bacterium]
MAFLELRGVTKRFDRAAAVDSFTLAVSEGELVSFLGGSGCGKTTTLRMIAGFESPSTGSISIGGLDVVEVPPHRRGVGMVFQNYALFPNMTAEKNIGFGLRVAGKKPDEVRRRVRELLGLIGMEYLGGRFPHQLSGGQQQRVALARALAIQPRVLLLDEPLSALDAGIRVRLREEIRAIQRQLRITTIYVTHDQEEALSLSDRVVVMRDGRIVQVGTPFEIYNHPASDFVASFIGSLNTLAAEVVDPEAGTLSVEGQLISTVSAIPLAKGQRVPVSLRPERITLSNGRPDSNSLAGTVTAIEFLGSIVRIFLKVGNSQLFLDTFNNPHLSLPAEGTPVTAWFPREACLLADEGSATKPDPVARPAAQPERSRP